MDQQLIFSPTGARQLVDGPAGKIEVDARLAKGRQDLSSGVLVLCHPHPLFGGTMDNKVVTTLARAGRDLGLAQLRFNFRGVGQSEGVHAEMKGEADDLKLLLERVQHEAPAAPLVLAGFSFGSGVCSLVVPDFAAIHSLFLVAPPVSKYRDTYLDSYPCPVSVFQGDSDEVIDSAATRRWVESLKSRCDFYWFEHTGHFFHGRLTDLYRDFSVALRKSDAVPA